MKTLYPGGNNLEKVPDVKGAWQAKEGLKRWEQSLQNNTASVLKRISH